MIHMYAIYLGHLRSNWAQIQAFETQCVFIHFIQSSAGLLYYLNVIYHCFLPYPFSLNV